MNKTGSANALKAIVIAGLLVLDLVLAHTLSCRESVQGWGVLVAATPLSLLGVFTIRRFLGNLAALFTLLVLITVGTLLFTELKQHVEWIYFFQNVTINLLLATWFGRTLLHHREPLCTSFANLLHSQMNPLLLRYTRWVTVAWTGFFLVMATTSMALFLLAPIGVWSTFANLLTLPLVIAMFGIEYLVRLRVLPPEDHLGITSAFRAYRHLITQKGQTRNNQGKTSPERPS